ncbi:putative ABC multidrug transporter [Xylariaceae sp. FL0662B]|nr:putative ABC multidrug transporter [Xylariaceae sp. FL0662B]
MVEEVDTPSGLSFLNLQCHGVLSSALYQPTIASYMFAVPRLFLRLLPNRTMRTVKILQDFDGLVLPGEMLLVLGRPGSGCSTLLKTLAGDTHGFRINDEKSINYHGISFQQMHHEFKGGCVYLSELDVHFPELTLGETLIFAASTRTAGPDQITTPSGVGRTAADLFSLDEAFDTKVGNSMIRGLSGGEKKRTSLAEAFISGAQFQCWDNSTRGLDSSTAIRCIELLRKSTESLQTTVIMSIYQASEAMYQKFDKVTLLYEGRQIYFGPADLAEDYFHRLGFIRPNRTTTADFLTSLTNPAERIIREGYENRAPRSPDDFAGIWKQSAESKALRNEISKFNTANPIQAQRVKADYRRVRLQRCTYTLSLCSQILICIKRGFVRLRNNYGPGVAALFGNTVLAIVIGSIFYNLGPGTDSLDRRDILIFFALMTSAFSPAFEVATMWAQRPIVEKHNSYAFYHPIAEGVASMICDVPFKLVNSFMFHIPIYFMTNLRRTAGAFFTYWFFTFMTVLTMSMAFRMIGSLSRTLGQSMPPCSTIVVLAIICTGFVIPPSYMVPWLGWFRWISPVSYTYESLMINEYHDRQFPCTTLVPTGSNYFQGGMQGKTCSSLGSVSGQEIVQGSNYLSVKYGYTMDHLWRNLPILIAMMIAFCAIHLCAAEYIPAQRSRGEILLFPRRHAGRLYKESYAGEAADSKTFAQDVNAETHVTGQQEYRVAASEKDAVETIQRQSAVFHWRNLNYEIKTHDGKRRILKDLHGWVKPGTLTALMGVTGAGKTSLLDVLADRVATGVATGDVHIDDKLRDATFGRRIGYVQQEDIHLPTTTVREALQFSALLRQSKDKSKAERLSYVDSVLDMLDMEAYADAIVGVPGEGLNVEQRKRLTIAVEMVARPDILLFLDEPTSGLDSQTAWSICMLLRKLADNGQAILCTIHQPSSQLFQTFDSLLLLKKGGTQLYFGPIGPGACVLIDYFERNGAVKCPIGANPAEWIIEATRVEPQSTDAEKHDFADRWNASNEKQEVLQHIENLRVNVREKTDLRRKDGYAVSTLEQLVVVTTRTFQQYWRDPGYLYSKITVSLGITLVNGLSFTNSPLDIQGFTDLLFSIFLITQLFPSVGQQIIPRLTDGRALFEARERRNRSYSWVVFIASNVIVELCWQTLVGVLVYITWYYPTGMWRNGDANFSTTERGGLIFTLIWIFHLWTSTLSQAMAAGVEHSETAVQYSVLLFWLSLVFSGILVFPNALPGFWVFVYRASPLSYLSNGIILGGLANTHITCSSKELLKIDMLPPGYDSCGDYLGPYAQSNNGYIENPGAASNCSYCSIADTNSFLGGLGMNTQNPWENVGFMVVYVVFNILLTFVLYWAARVPRKSKGSP